MSPTILGDHYDIGCDVCGFQFACDIEQANLRRELICSNCGSEIDRRRCQEMPADSVSVGLSNQLIQRWDVVAFQMPLDSNPASDSIAGIKRVLGLPGESVEFRNGNVVADGSVARKNLAQQKQVRIPILDSACRSNQVPRHWGLPGDTQWSVDEQIRFHPTRSNDDLDWFAFLNQRNFSHPVDTNPAQSAGHPIEDFYAFNQSLSRDLHEMDEVFVEIEISPSVGGTFAWRFNHRGDQYQFQLKNRQFMVHKAASGSASNPTVVPLDHDPFSQSTFQVDFSSFDEQIAVWLDGRQIFCQPLTASENPIARKILYFGAANSELTINRIQIWRDLYYFSSLAEQTANPVTIQPDAFFVVGDNVPCSRDSRHWQTPSLSKSRVIGKVKRP